MIKTIGKLMVLSLLATACVAQPSGSEAAPTAKTHHHAKKTKEVKKEAASAEDVKQLKETVQEQQAEINQLKQTVAQHAQQTEHAQQDAAAAAEKASASQAEAANATAKADAVKADVTDLKTATTNTAVAVTEEQKRVNDLETPLAIHYKGLEFYPGGYLAAESVWRQHAEQTDVLSSFNGIPYPSTPSANLTEFRGTGRQSRLAFKVISHPGAVKLTGYYEMDFLGAAPTANENQSNSFTPRLRQALAIADWKGWSVTGGQAWSLLTLNKKGIETLGWWNPNTVDAQYVVGFTFARLWEMRVAKSFNDGKETAAFSIENSAYLPTGKVPNGVIYGGTGSGSMGNSNTYTDSLAPDVVAKLAFDPSFGHFEIKAIGRFLRDRIPTNTTSTVAPPDTTNTVATGGIGAGAYVPVLHKKLTLIGETLLGRGTARYGDSSNADFTYKANGGIVPLQNLQALGGIEVQPTPKLQVYFYGGDEYIGQASKYGGGFGYGSGIVANNATCLVKDNGTCSAELRNLIQGTAGFWYDIHKGNYGTFRYGMQYSYTKKETWGDALGNSPEANENMAFTSLRYYLP